MKTSDDEFLKRLQAAFKTEAEEHLQAISTGLMELEASPDAARRKEVVTSIFREAHSLKGAARAVNLAEVESICQSLESVLALWRRRDVAPASALLDPLHAAVSAMSLLLPGPDASHATVDQNAVIAALNLLAEPDAAEPDAAEPGGDDPVALLAENAAAVEAENIAAARRSPLFSPGDAIHTQPPARHFQPTPAAQPSVFGTSAREAIVRRPPGEHSPSQPAPPHRPARRADGAPMKHGLSDTLRISTAKLDALLLHAEEMLSVKLAENQRSADLKAVAALIELWEKEWSKVSPDVRGARELLDAGGARADARPRSAAPDFAAARAMAATTKLVDFLEWNQAHLKAVHDRLASLGNAADHDRRSTAALVDTLLDGAKKLLMLPFATLLELFPKLVRDLSRDQGKDVDLVLRGGDVEIDKRILEEMKDPLIHILRNSIDHGVETPARRALAGKPPRGAITVAVSQVDGNKVEILIADDGGGIDPAAVRDAAVRHGTLPAEDARAMSDRQALWLIFQPEVSTSPILTEISGRGLGLAIVKEKVEKLGGRVDVETRLGAGTSFRLLLPLTLATFRGILVRSSGQVFVIPTADVERVVRVTPEDVRTVQNRQTLSLNGRATSLIRLDEVLELPGATPRAAPAAGDFVPVVVLGSGEKRVAFQVDAVVNEQEVLVKPLARPLSRVRNVAGATVLGSGKAVPILNVSDLLKSAARRGGAAPSARGASAGDAQKSVLIAEDSITARMLLKNILESAGHKVKTAVDGVDALTQLRAEDFDLLVSDVEMPRMNGFELTGKVRGDGRLEKLPVVLVTALASREDRERGMDAGANAYIVKSSFDQGNLLDVVGRLL